MPLWSILFIAACGDADAVQQSKPDESTPVRVAEVRQETVAPPVVATGVVAAKEEVALSFKVGGVIARVFVNEGDAVRAGQVLATIDAREIDAQVSKARSAAAKAERDLARVRALYRDSVATLAQMEDATTGAEVARADVEAAAMNRRYADVVAPAAGVVLRRAAEPGQLVAAGAPVITLGSAARGTVLRAGLADRDVVRVRAGDRATARFDAFPGRPVAGTVRQIAAAATPGAGTYAVEVALDDAAGLASGMVGRLEIEPARGERLPVVPVEALVEADGDQAAVFALSPDGRRARRVPVAVAFVRGGRVAVRRGLDGVSAVVTDGAPYLDDGSAVRVLP
ncbi:MAG TPA: efflux RND transporter periplasmic adaptor subunit [Gemmatimonadaceae bacterium]|nr:efflux RND transporter periplasmic adaptor subunit [Gemmatimonadaceae bacterium]